MLAHREFEEEGADADDLIISIEFHNSPTTTTVSFPLLRCWASGEDLEYLDEDWFDPEVLIPGVEPLVFGALFAGLDYLSYRWEAEDAPVRLPRVGIGRPKEILPTLGRLLHRKGYLRRRMEFLEGNMQKPELQKLWAEIGDESGLVPDRQGRKSAKLDAEDEKKLIAEGTALVMALRELEPDESEKKLIAELLVSNPDHFPHLILLRESFNRPERLTSQLERHGADLDLDYWVHRLNFPMLRRNEVEALLASPRKNPKTLATQLLADRLGVKPKTLANP